MDRLNPNGGSIAIGHPFGMTGSRLVGTIANEMKRRKARYGVVTMCVGGGQGGAALCSNAPDHVESASAQVRASSTVRAPTELRV